MTKHLRRIIEIISKNLPAFDSILEIGSRQEKNQKAITNLRILFKYKKYLGLDFRKGSGVDIVANAEKLPFKDKTQSLVLCLETLEHTIRPWKIASEIERVIKDDGIIIISSQQNYPLHKHPSDYFRYTPFGLSALFEKLKDNIVMNISVPFLDEVRNNPQLVILIGWKRPNKQLKDKIKLALIKNKAYISGHKPYRHRFSEFFKLLYRSFEELFYRIEILFIDTKK